MSKKPRGKYWTHVRPRFDEIEAWLEKGLSEEQIYTNLGVGKTSWYNYKQKHPELVEILKKGREVQVREVENALFKNATGYYYEEELVFKMKDPDGFERLERVTVKKFKPPETGAIAFFLKNKAPDRYADNPQMVDIKRQELELRREVAKFQMF